MNLTYAGMLFRDATLAAYRTPDGDLLVISSSDGRRAVLLVTEESVRTLKAAEIRALAMEHGLDGLDDTPSRPRRALVMA